jgi:hypothetical protein
MRRGSELKWRPACPPAEVATDDLKGARLSDVCTSPSIDLKGARLSDVCTSPSMPRVGRVGHANERRARNHGGAVRRPCHATGHKSNIGVNSREFLCRWFGIETAAFAPELEQPRSGVQMCVANSTVGTVAIFAALLACGASSQDHLDRPHDSLTGSEVPPATDQDAAQSSDVDPTASTSSDPPEDGPAVVSVQSEQILGVWLFSNDARDYDQALLTGQAAIVNDCLLVNNVVVIWHVSRLAEVKDALHALQAGEDVSFRVGGSLTEKQDAIVAPHCPGLPVWLGSPAP